MTRAQQDFDELLARGDSATQEIISTYEQIEEVYRNATVLTGAVYPESATTSGIALATVVSAASAY
jgi:hypothetical protein